MKFYRLFVCLALLAFQLSPCLAWNHGSIPGNFQRVTVNVLKTVDQPFINIAKGMGFFVSPTNCSSPPCTDSNGYPNQAPTSTFTANPNFPGGYYGTYTWSWTGTAGMSSSSPPIIIVSGGASVFELAGASSGDFASANITVACTTYPTCNGATNPSIVFQYGWNIQSIQNDGSGHIQINTKTNFVGSSCWGSSGYDQNNNFGPLVNISGANSNTGANGIWAIQTCNASSFVLTGSTFSNAQASAAGTAIFAGNNLHFTIRNTGTFSGFTNLVIAKTVDIAAINAGRYFDATYTTQLKALMNPNGTCATNHSCGWLRFMDWNSSQGNWEKDYSQRIPTTAISYMPTTWYPAGYWVGSITNTSDALVASNPSASPATGAYVDGETVQGYISATNTGYKPTLSITRTGSSGAKPIMQKQPFDPLLLFQTGLPGSAGLTMQFTFSASWLNSGTPVVVNYTTVSGDTSAACTLSGNLNTFFNAQTTLTSAGIVFANPLCATGTAIYQPTAQAGRLSVTYTSGPAIITPGAMAPSTLMTGSSNLVTFKYNYLEDAWIYWSGEYAFSPPMEAAADLANQVGANVWWNFTQNNSGYVQSVTQNFATNLNTGLKFGFEQGNEDWNCFGPDPCPIYLTLGQTLGLTGSGNQAQFSYASLRTIQNTATAKTAWTGAGRSASDFYTFIMAQADGEATNGNFDNYQLKSTSIGTSNTWVASYGGPDGTAGSTNTVSTNYAATGNRAIDSNTNMGIGLAPYWSSPWWLNLGSDIAGTVTGNAPWLQAQLDYANSHHALAFSEIVNTFNGTTARTDAVDIGGLRLASGGSNENLSTMFTLMEAIAAEFDSYRTGASLNKVARFDYEGGPTWAFGNDINNGTNSPSDATALSVLTTQFGASGLNWNVSAYTFDGANTPSELAQQILTFTQAWKNDPTYSALIINSLYSNLKSISGSNREIHPAQYGYQANIWGLFPGDYHFGNNYQNYNAIATWNAGN